jgi:hypothetical protein
MGGRPSAATNQSNSGAASTAASCASCQSLAKKKGVNWALPNIARGSTGISRPIAVECYSDRLVILPDPNGRGRAQVIGVDGPLQDSIQEFVSGVWDHMEFWGMAVAGGYWKPMLKVQVARDAEARFLELQILLQDSGIVVVRRQ